MIRITSKTASALRSHACCAIHKSYSDAENGIATNKIAPSQKEAWHVAQLLASIRSMAKDWRNELTAELPGLTLSMSSVFTHQKPYVQWPKQGKGNHRCELADLLVAVIDRRTNSAKGFAILVQAKLSDDGNVTLKAKGEKDQFTLLSKRPAFDVCKTNGPTQVNLKSYSPDSALIYGFASRHAHLIWPSCGCCRDEAWLTADALGVLNIPPYSFTASETLSSVLVGLLQGNFGWEFSLPPQGKGWAHFATHPRCDWSMLINYLLEDTFKGSMSKKLQLPAGQTSRGKEDQFYFVAQTPQSAPMFFMTDGFNQLSQLSASISDILDGTAWIPSYFNRVNGDGGGDSRFGDSLDESENGAISSLIIEIGTQD